MAEEKEKGEPARRESRARQESRRRSPSLSPVIKKNIRAIIAHRQRAIRHRTLQQRISDTITDFSGSMVFVYLHVLWFAGWILLNSGWLGIKPFDPFPYGLLTMVVSLEAIFLSTFVLVSQNRMSEQDEQRAQLDLQINLLTEHELTRALKMLEDIQNRLGIEPPPDLELAELEKDTQPEEVLKEIEREEKGKRKNKR